MGGWGGGARRGRGDVWCDYGGNQEGDKGSNEERVRQGRE